MDEFTNLIPSRVGSAFLDNTGKLEKGASYTSA